MSDNECKQTRLRPYNAEEMKGLIGKIVKREKTYSLVVEYDEVTKEVLVGCTNYESDLSLMDNYTIDGKPCAVLVHLENGEKERKHKMSSTDRWKPEEGERFYFIDALGNVLWYLWGDPSDTLYYEVGNCFRTEEEAQHVSILFKKLLQENIQGI